MVVVLLSLWYTRVCVSVGTGCARYANGSAGCETYDATGGTTSTRCTDTAATLATAAADGGAPGQPGPA